MAAGPSALYQFHQELSRTIVCFCKGHFVYLFDSVFKNITEKILEVFIENKFYLNFQIKGKLRDLQRLL